MWRNWETRGVQVAVGISPWGFESSHPPEPRGRLRAAFVVSGRALGAARRDRQGLGSDEALEAAHDRPDGAQAQGRVAVDGLDAGLAHERRPAVGGVLLDPVREEHADGAGLVPVRELLRVTQPGVVAGERPDAPAQAGDEMVLAVVEDGER